MIFSALFLLAAAQGAPWYYPDASTARVPISDAFEMGRRVVVGLGEDAKLPSHPDIRSVRWLSNTPAVVLLTLKTGADPLLLSRTLHDRPDIRWSHPDFIHEPQHHALPNDPFVVDQWHLENTGQKGATGADINAEAAWDLTTGAGQLISIIDSGVDLGHPDLNGISGTDYIDDDDDSYPADKNAHGTACAGLAASVGNNEIGGAGVAYDAEVYGVRMLGGPISMSETYDAFVSSVDAGASVISNSWGYKNSCDGYALPQLLREALQYAEEQGRDGLGTLVIQAAGNNNCDISSDGLLAHETVVAVAALGAGDGKESYSSYGDPIDIAAPSGGLITTTVEGAYGVYKEDPLYTDGMSGTSAATPVAAGVFALMFSVNERLTAADARDIVCQTATRNDIINGDFNEDGWSPYFGCGRIDAGAAVFAAANEPPMAPESAMTVDTVYEDRIWLDWTEAIDPDNDRLTYRIKWWTELDAIQEQVLDGQSIEVTGAAIAGETLVWQVQAIDLWGAGPWSTPVSLSVIARPEPEELPEEVAGACGTLPLSSTWVGLLTLAFFRRRT